MIAVGSKVVWSEEGKRKLRRNYFLRGLPRELDARVTAIKEWPGSATTVHLDLGYGNPKTDLVMEIGDVQLSPSP